jgi:hypothetical protein
MKYSDPGIRLAAGLAIAAIFASAANAEEKSYAFSDFTQISVSAGIDAEVKVGGDYSIVAESSSNGLERLEVKVRDGELSLGRKSSFRWKRGDQVRVRVSLPSLDGLEVSSGASIDAVGVDAGSFSIDASSGGNLDVTGTCNDLNVDVSSGGNIDARGLECRNAVADASSGGNADIYASESVSGDASSGGDIDVYGSPERVSKSTSSGGRVSVN